MIGYFTYSTWLVQCVIEEYLSGYMLEKFNMFVLFKSSTFKEVMKENIVCERDQRFWEERDEKVKNVYKFSKFEHWKHIAWSPVSAV